MTRPVDPLGAQLRQIREAAGYSLQQVEDKSGGRWKATVVGSWERGDRQPTVRTARELLAFFQHRLTVLAHGDVVLPAGHRSGESHVEYVVVVPGLDWPIPCSCEQAATSLASLVPGARAAYRTVVVGDPTFVDTPAVSS